MPLPVAISSVRKGPDVAIVAALARTIWDEHHAPIIGQSQVDYMIGKFQTVDALQSQLADGYEYFLVSGSGRAIGYFAVREQPEQNRLFISKFYLHKDSRGTGTGRVCMEFIEQLARQRGLGLLWLTVNKGNPAVKVYERLGFRIATEILIDIGNGFVMDDYRMHKLLEPAAHDPVSST